MSWVVVRDRKSAGHEAWRRRRRRGGIVGRAEEKWELWFLVNLDRSVSTRTNGTIGRTACHNLPEVPARNSLVVLGCVSCREIRTRVHTLTYHVADKSTPEDGSKSDPVFWNIAFKLFNRCRRGARDKICRSRSLVCF